MQHQISVFLQKNAIISFISSLTFHDFFTILLTIYLQITKTFYITARIYMFSVLKKSSPSTHCYIKSIKYIYISLCFIMLFALCSCSNFGVNYTAPTLTHTSTEYSEVTVQSTSTAVSSEVTASLEPTVTAESSSTFQATATPEVTPTPEITNAPNVTATSDVTATPEITGKPTSKPTSNASTVCAHKSITIKNKTKATCTKAGFSGDTYCLMCGNKVSSGSKIPATGHQNTEVRNKKEATSSQNGYTGDIYCKDCETKIASGSSIPKKENPNIGKVEYIMPDGTSAFVDANISDVTGHYMAEKTKNTTHLYIDVEKEIVRLCNIERAKENLSALNWFEDAYYFTKIRAEEAATLFSHTRPNGKPWYSVCFDAGVVVTGYYGENLGITNGATPDQFAAAIVDSWMNSHDHRANIMNGNYRRIAVAIVQNGDQLTAVQFFFS